MLAGWGIILVLLGYISVLFAIAYYGDNLGTKLFQGVRRPILYALGLCIYCTSWTFYGSVGVASTTGLDFIPIYLGPILVILFAKPAIEHILYVSKTQNITSVADFLAARFGKKESVAAIVTIMMVIGVVPYLALQIKAISTSLAMVYDNLDTVSPILLHHTHAPGGFWISVLLAFFTLAFGTRRVEATEHQDGLMLAIAAESVFKLLAFLTVGIFVTWYMFHGPADLLTQAASQERIRNVFLSGQSLADWLVVTLISGFAFLLLPRQFHVMVVENRDVRDFRWAAWIFPAYLVAINLFVMPLAVAGLLKFPEGEIFRDWTVLGLPLLDHQNVIAIIAMIGGFSASTAMVVVASVALSIMVSNDLVIPMLLRWRARRPRFGSSDITALILNIRRGAIIVVIGLSYIYMMVSDDAALASIGLLSFAAIAQLGPAFLGGMLWQGANTRGANAGLITGFVAWALILFLPSIWPHPGQPAETLWLSAATFSHWLGQNIGLTLSPLSAGTMASLILNSLAFVLVSLTRSPNMIERLQARIFMGERASVRGPYRNAWQQNKSWQSGMTAQDLEDIVARYMGPARAKAAFASFNARRSANRRAHLQLDIETMHFAEQTMASIIGAASARLVLSLALRQRNFSRTAALEIVDEASAAIRENHNLLQHAIDFAQQGITVFDKDLRLVFWNRGFCDIFNYPPHLVRLGVSLEEMIRGNVARGLYGPGDPEQIVARRLSLLTNTSDPVRLKVGADTTDRNVVEIRSSRMPEGGLVTTYTDITQQVQAEEALASVNETLEMRVRERTDELTRLNGELEQAKRTAEEANQSKTRFLAAASHDILQPLNAARLFATALAEHSRTPTADAPKAANETHDLAHNIDASLEAVEEILTALLDMSRLDAGAMKAETSAFRIDDILNQLKVEFSALAKEKNLKLTFLPSQYAVRSDRRLLRRLLQNLVSNAIKYTTKGKVLIGCRLNGTRLRIEVWDTGLGIPENKRKAVFREFERLDSGARTAQGLGLGLSIVERIALVLGHRIILRSWSDRGSMFAVEVPIAPTIPAQALTSDTSQVTGIRHQPLEGMNLIAIDDEQRILDGLVVLLRGWGCQVMTATNKAQAEIQLAAARSKPDAILADYHLGDELGIEVITTLRWKFGNEIPAILMTADRSQAVRVEAGMKDINLLHKPVKPAALRALLTQWRVNRFAAE
ncbi:MAG: PAS-domain containing protein [Hyphomicrobiales bacterium]|nr:PAS-domain containing protein [Hyphomicrobiales bacterium]MDE2113694.1 PAS-domain containing protein [Hyphomicrobiales bacterium]